MLPSEINLDGIVNNDFKQIVFERRSARYLDPDYVIPREEIEQLIQETIVSTPTAVDTQPLMFLVIDTDEGKEKIDSIMRGIDKDRTNKCSFTLVPCADRRWYERFDEHIRREQEACPEAWPPQMVDIMVPATMEWVDELLEGNGEYLDKSVNFQIGMAAMNFMNICRAHGYDTGVMDAWDPAMLADLFGLDMDRYIPQVAIAVGKSIGEPGPGRYRYPANELIQWG